MTILCRVGWDTAEAVSSLSKALFEVFKKAGSRPIVLVFVGTDRSTGDCFAPLIGTRLTEKKVNGVHIYGTLDEPVHSLNIRDRLEKIQANHNFPFVIGIDAALGKFDSVGFISLEDIPLRPGSGLRLNLPPVGAYSLTAVVNIAGFMENLVLQNTRLSVVRNLARMTEKALRIAITKNNRRRASQNMLIFGEAAVSKATK